MGIGSFDRRCAPGPMAEINVIPLVDVMLVLLVIFIITAPLLTHSVKIDLPRASTSPQIARASPIALGIRSDGSLEWNGAPVSRTAMAARFSAEAGRQPQPELHIHADRRVHYEAVAQVMADAANAGLLRIGFVTVPDAP